MYRVWVGTPSHPTIATAHADFDAAGYFGHRFEIADGGKKTPAVLLEECGETGCRRLVLTETQFQKSYPVMNGAALALAELVAAHYFAETAEVIEQMLPPALSRRGKAEAEHTVLPVEPPELNERQAAVAAAIEGTPAEKCAEHLIWGVTGSGKTRIYEHLIARALERGQQVLLLVPEIALSGQIMQVITSRFPGRVVLYHSGLADGERLRNYRNFLSGRAQIAVGTRSAVFLPAHNLGLIVMDEEHDGSFKDQRNLRFDTRVVARLRQNAAAEKPKLVLASATPSLESLARVKAGAASLHRLRERATGQSLPLVHVPDYHTQHGLISPFLMEKIHEHLHEKNQVLLLMNRRGHSTHVHCPVCDGYAECPRCAVSLTYHKDNLLRCHHCGYNEPYTRTCPKDGELRRLSGRGIQKVEEILEARFPSANYARLDRDTTRTRGFTGEVLQAMQERRIDILIGTQMIAKGFDIEGVTLVGVLAIDQMLNAPDYRASEQAWQLLAQVVGRSGRHRPGEVVIQTMEPQHAAIRAAQSHNADAFYAAEAEQRRLTGYPPFGALARLVLKGTDERELFAFAEKLGNEIRPQNTRDLFAGAAAENAELLGPALPGLTKLENEYRVHFLIKARQENTLRIYLKRILPVIERLKRAADKISVTLDLDPREMS